MLSIEVVYKPGKEQVTTGMLSRAPVEVAKDGAPREQILTVKVFVTLENTRDNVYNIKVAFD